MCKSEIFAKIIALVSKGTEIPTELIVSDNRVTEIVNARYILVYILYEKGFYPSQISSLIHKTKRSVNYMISNFEGGNLAASKIRNLECPNYEICLIDYGCGKFNRKIHIMEQYP